MPLRLCYIDNWTIYSIKDAEQGVSMRQEDLGEAERLTASELGGRDAQQRRLRDSIKDSRVVRFFTKPRRPPQENPLFNIPASNASVGLRSDTTAKFATESDGSVSQKLTEERTKSLQDYLVSLNLMLTDSDYALHDRKDIPLLSVIETMFPSSGDEARDQQAEGRFERFYTNIIHNAGKAIGIHRSRRMLSDSLFHRVSNRSGSVKTQVKKIDRFVFNNTVEVKRLFQWLATQSDYLRIITDILISFGERVTVDSLAQFFANFDGVSGNSKEIGGAASAAVVSLILIGISGNSAKQRITKAMTILKTATSFGASRINDIGMRHLLPELAKFVIPIPVFSSVAGYLIDGVQNFILDYYTYSEHEAALAALGDATTGSDFVAKGGGLVAGTETYFKTELVSMMLKDMEDLNRLCQSFSQVNFFSLKACQDYKDLLETLEFANGLQDRLQRSLVHLFGLATGFMGMLPQLDQSISNMRYLVLQKMAHYMKHHEEEKNCSKSNCVNTIKGSNGVGTYKFRWSWRKAPRFSAWMEGKRKDYYPKLMKHASDVATQFSEKDLLDRYFDYFEDKSTLDGWVQVKPFSKKLDRTQPANATHLTEIELHEIVWREWYGESIDHELQAYKLSKTSTVYQEAKELVEKVNKKHTSFFSRNLVFLFFNDIQQPGIKEDEFIRNYLCWIAITNYHEQCQGMQVSYQLEAAVIAIKSSTAYNVLFSIYEENARQLYNHLERDRSGQRASLRTRECQQLIYDFLCCFTTLVRKSERDFRYHHIVEKSTKLFLMWIAYKCHQINLSTHPHSARSVSGNVFNHLAFNNPYTNTVSQHIVSKGLDPATALISKNERLMIEVIFSKTPDWDTKNFNGVSKTGNLHY